MTEQLGLPLLLVALRQFLKADQLVRSLITLTFPTPTSFQLHFWSILQFSQRPPGLSSQSWQLFPPAWLEWHQEDSSQLFPPITSVYLSVLLQAYRTVLT
jgi:hypothetical protein